MNLPKDTRLAIRNVCRKWDSCKKCGIGIAAMHIVHMRGCPNEPLILFVGEAPGKEEDKEGIPFVGRSGKLLNELIVQVGLKEVEYCIINPVACRPFNEDGSNRRPNETEINNCLPRFIMLYELINSKGLVTLGKVAHEIVTEHIPKIDRFYYLSIYHPAYILRGGGVGGQRFKETLGELIKFVQDLKQNQKKL